MTTSYKLVYFNTRVRAEVSRFILAAARQKYQDHRLDLLEWRAWSKEQKASIGAPFGQLPILEVTENSELHVIAQSHTVRHSFSISRNEILTEH